MTHRADSRTLSNVLEAMRLEPSTFLEAKPYERIEDRRGYASAHAMRIILKGSLMILALMASRAEARSWRIFEDGSGDAPTIQAGIDSSMSGDSILVAPGTYDENLNAFGKSLYIAGESGAEVTVVDGGQRGRVLLMGSGTVEELTLRNGRTSSAGGGVLIASGADALVRFCIIEDNVAGTAIDTGLGGGINCGFSPLTLIERNVIRNNTAGNAGGGISGVAEIRENLVYGNAAHNAGGGIDGGGVVVGNVIVDNYSDNQSAGVHGGGVFRSNTIMRNIVGQPGVVVNSLSSSDVIGNIFIWNTSLVPNGLANVLACSECSLQCNDIWGNDNDTVVGSGNTQIDGISLDPEFCAIDPVGSKSFGLQEDSPCALGNHPSGAACGLIGAHPVDCDTVSVEQRTWGSVKSLYR